MKFLISMLFFAYSITAVAFQPTTWKTAVEQGKGSITIYWYGSEPFIFYDENGYIIGIEHDVFEGFKGYLKQTHSIDLHINWVKATSFGNTLNLIKNESSSGFFGCSAFSITEERKLAVAFSTPYLADIAVLISSENIPIISNEDEFKTVFSNFTGISIKGTTYEKKLKEIRKRFDMKFKIAYISSSKNILDTLTSIENTFGYIDLPIYLTNLKNNPELKILRHNVFPIKSEGYGFIMPKNTDWQQPFNEYLNSSYFEEKSRGLIGKYLQQDIYNLIKSISSDEQVNPDEEILLLTKEKEIQYQELLENALSQQQNKNFIKFIIVAFILAIIALTVLYKFYVNKAKSNSVLLHQKDKIEQQQESIESQNKAIEKRNNELVALNEEKNNLIHILAHDLRTPINQISGLVNIHTLQHKKISSEDKVLFDTIMGSITRLNDMISKILNVDAIESQEANIKIEEVDLSELLLEEVTQSIQEAEKKSIIIEANLSAKVVVKSDPIYLRQIFENLLSNAIKFSYPGSVVNLSVTKGKEEVLVLIADQGPGFTQQDMKKIFGKFQRLSAKPTAGEPSTGLGLSIVKKYIDLLNGSIKCDSAIGEGAVFTISLPTG